MICPGCNSAMRTELVGKDTVDICVSCKSVWFDQGEAGAYLRRLIVKTESSAAVPPAGAPLRPANLRAGANYSGISGLCPRCQVEVVPFNYAYDSNVSVVKCPGCQGIWATRDQLKAIAVHLKRHPADQAIGEATAQRAAFLESISQAGPSIPAIPEVLGAIDSIIDFFE